MSYTTPPTPIAVGGGQAVVSPIPRGFQPSMNPTQWLPEFAPNQHDGSKLSPAQRIAAGPRTPYTVANPIPGNGWLPTYWTNCVPLGAPMPLFRTAGPYAAPGQPTPTLVASAQPGPR